MNKIIVFLHLMFALFTISMDSQTKKSTDRKIKFDYDWKFKLGDHPDASHVNYNDTGWSNIDLPHDWSIEGAFDANNQLLSREMPKSVVVVGGCFFILKLDFQAPNLSTLKFSLRRFCIA